MNLVTCHIVGPGFVRFRRKVRHQVFHTVLQNASFSWSFLADQKLLEVEKQMANTSCKVGAIWRAPNSFLFMRIIPAFFEQPTPFPRIFFLLCSFTTYLINLPVNFHRTYTFSFENLITLSTLHVMQFSIFFMCE